MINIMNVALSIHTQTEKAKFSCKDDCTLTKHTRYWTYSALQYFCTSKSTSVYENIQRQAGAELGQAQLKLELGFTSTRILGTALMIATCYIAKQG